MRLLFSSFAVAVLMLCGFATTAVAGDCNKVRFEFTNSTGAKVKVKKVHIKGNDGSWNENISNKQILTGKKHKTAKRRLNKLDSGKKGDFTVKYDRWDAPNNKWKAASQKFSGLKCTDGKTFKFDLTRK